MSSKRYYLEWKLYFYDICAFKEGFFIVLKICISFSLYYSHNEEASYARPTDSIFSQLTFRWDVSCPSFISCCSLAKIDITNN